MTHLALHRCQRECDDQPLHSYTGDVKLSTSVNGKPVPREKPNYLLTDPYFSLSLWIHCVITETHSV